MNSRLSFRDIVKRENTLFLLSGNGALFKVDLHTKEVTDIAPYFEEYPSMNSAPSLFIKNDLIIIGKNRGAIEISRDGGENWEERKIFDNSIDDIIEHKANLILRLRNDYKDYLIAIYDLDKNELTPISRFYNHIWKLKSIDDKLFVCGSDGLLAFTENLGKSWKHFNTKLPWSVKDLNFYKGYLYALSGFDESYTWKIDLESNTITKPKMILKSGSYSMDIDKEKLFLWSSKPDKILSYELGELFK